MSELFSKYSIIRSPIITEKATTGRMNLNKYSMFVDVKANKKQIKDAIENLFDVNVISVNTSSVQGKSKRLGRFEGKTSNRKKAVITLKQGDRIKLMEGP